VAARPGRALDSSFAGHFQKNRETAMVAYYLFRLLALLRPWTTRHPFNSKLSLAWDFPPVRGRARPTLSWARGIQPKA